MKLKKTILMTLVALSGVLVLSLGTFFTTFAAEDNQVTTMAATAPLNLRDAAGSNGNVITVIPAGTSVKVFSMTSAGWYNVEYNGQNGYCYYVYLNFEGNVDGTVHDGKVTDMYTTAPLNVRATPNTSSTILGSFEKGATVPVVSKHDGWFKVSYNGQEGYCHGGYLDFGKDGNTASVETSTMNELTTTAPLNVRNVPNTNGQIIGSFAKGEHVKVIAQEGNWYKVKYKDTTGYSHSGYFE